MFTEPNQHQVEATGSGPDPPHGLPERARLLVRVRMARIGTDPGLDLDGNHRIGHPHDQIDLSATTSHVAGDDGGPALLQEAGGQRFAQSGDAQVG